MVRTEVEVLFPISGGCQVSFLEVSVMHKPDLCRAGFAEPEQIAHPPYLYTLSEWVAVALIERHGYELTWANNFWWTIRARDYMPLPILCSLDKFLSTLTEGELNSG